jgi:hypothetical protein
MMTIVDTFFLLFRVCSSFFAVTAVAVVAGDLALEGAGALRSVLNCLFTSLCCRTLLVRSCTQGSAYEEAAMIMHLAELLIM